MLLTTPIFIFIFLPAVALMYWILVKSPLKSFAGSFICLASLIFYSYGKTSYLLIIAISIGINFLIGSLIFRKRFSRLLLYLGIAFNLLWLGWFKYLNFAIDIINNISASSFPAQNLILPVGISFYTFQQIAWLVDIYSGKFTKNQIDFIDYCCFITFFPQLMAGPIVHHSEMMPQFHDAPARGIDWENIFNGLVLFFIGLAKKLLVADNLAPIVNACFDVSPSLTFPEALLAGLTYSLQLYFDFSGYCDIAIGCALFFNIKLPLNFDSPYLAANIREFWHRWHITLSRWLRDYLYIPLGGNRKGGRRTLVNLFVTFLLGGIWHGAAWNFALWGAMHGVAIGTHRIWQRLGLALPRILGICLTFLFVTLAWIVFRAPDNERLRIFRDALLGFNGFQLRIELFAERHLASIWNESFLVYSLGLVFCVGLVFYAPNSSAILNWPDRAKLWFSLVLAILVFAWLLLPKSNPPFIYSQF